MTQASCYLIMAGGTGGHIFPAMAVAKALIETGAEVHWLGTQEGMEANIVPDAGIPLYFIDIKGFRGKGLLSKMVMPFKLFGAVLQAIKVIKKVKASTVVGFGGYVAAPGGIAAKILRKPLVIHEQNSVAGSTNKMLAKLASVTLEAFPKSLQGAQWVGNPVRKEVGVLFDRKYTLVNGAPKKLLIMGGSLGALAINQIMPDVIAGLPLEKRPEVWHQAGKDKLDALQVAYKSNDVDVRAEEFITDVASAYQWADIIICRAGALTVSEVAVAGVPAIFIPYPYAIDNHQYHNAQWLVENEAAFSIEQKNVNKEILSKQLEVMLSDNELLKTMSENLKKLAMPNATGQVVTICEQACKKQLGVEGNSHAA